MSLTITGVKSCDFLLADSVAAILIYSTTILVFYENRNKKFNFKANGRNPHTYFSYLLK